METNQELKNSHKFSIKGIFPKYIIRKFLYSYSMLISVGITAILSFLIIYFKLENTFTLLDEIINITLDLLPNILGFCIGGYALIIGIGNIEALKKMSSPMEKRDNLSFFQILSSVFAGSLVLQCITLLLSFIIKIILKLEITVFSKSIAIVVNCLTIISILFLSTLSLVLLYYTVINLFNYGQSMHFLIRLKKMNKMNNKSDIIFSNAIIEVISTHYIGNKTYNENCYFSKASYMVSEKVLPVLLKYFTLSFNKNIIYQFFHEADLSLNEIYVYASAVFKNHNEMHVQSINIAKHLYERSDHPKIKGGDFHIVLFRNCYFEGHFTDVLGLFKSETKDTFLKVYHDNIGYKIETEYGININKLDKGCLIFNVDEESGFSILTIDNSSKGTEAQYWINDFLHVRQRKDNFNQTQNMFSLCKSFVSQLPSENGKVEKATYMNRSVEALKEESVNINTFAEQVFETPKLVSEFKQYKETYQRERDIEIDDTFETESAAIKRRATGTMTTIKLDRNFDINIHGGEQYIVRGYDEDRKMYYYQLFFKEEK